MQSKNWLVYAVAGWLCASGGYAQREQTPPLEVKQTTAVEAEPGGQARDVLGLEVRNTSSRRVRGFAVCVNFTDGETGAPTTYLCQNILKATKEGEARYQFPGDTLSVRSIPIPRNASGVPDRPAVKVDIVVFDDGSSWGPGKSRASLRLIGQIQELDRKTRSK